MTDAERQQKLQGELHKAGLDAVLVTHPANVRYLCGFTGSAGWLLVPVSGRPTLLTDGRYTVQAREEVPAARVVIAKGALAAAAAQRAGPGLLGFEAEHTTVQARDALRRGLGKAVRLKSTSGLVEKLRLIKDAEELGRLRRAVRLGSSVFRAALQALQPGVAETQVAGALEYAARRAGAEGMAFETIVAGGVRSALPHGRASSARLPRRGFVVLDYGVILAGYCSDMSRTVHLGKPGAEARRLYEAVREAQQAGLEAVRAGVTAGAVDAAARRVLQRARLGRYFTHSTGHGVGLEIHEAPRVARGQTTELQPGMVISVEPGAYVPGYGGVRIEDMVAVTAHGCEVLTPTSKDLLTI